MDMPCRSSRHQRRFMRAMIVGGLDPRRLHHDYVPLSDDDVEETNDEEEHDEEEHDEEEYNADEEKNTRYARLAKQLEHDEYEEKDRNRSSNDLSIESLLMQWRSEIAHEMMFGKESRTPLPVVHNTRGTQGDEENEINFDRVATVAARLFELWNALGVSYQARRKTLRGLHATARAGDARVLFSAMVTMQGKLETMVEVVRREMAAVRRCDVLLRQCSQGARPGEQLHKLVEVLQRVLSKWEKTHGRPFLFRGLRYLDLMECLLRQIKNL